MSSQTLSIRLIYSFTVIFFFNAFTVSTSGRHRRATSNRDPRYDVWQNPQRILFRMDTVYNSTQRAAIREAMEQITDDTQACIRFEPLNVVTDSREDHILITPRFSSGEDATTCATFPGRVVRQNGAGQKLFIFGGNGGCMSTKRDLMAILMPVLGIRNEYKRPDRDLFLHTFPANILSQFQNLEILKPYNRSQVNTGSSSFDLHSITMPSPSRFAKPNTVLFTPRNASAFIGFLPRLSVGDCNGLKTIYPQCSRTVCTDPYANVTAAEAAETSSWLFTSSNINNPQLSASGAGTVIAAIGSTTKLNRAVARATHTTPHPTTHKLLQSNLNGNQVAGGPVDPNFGGLEFWLDPVSKKV